MAKKTKSKPMGEIVKRIKMFEFVHVEIFDENQILNDPVEGKSWKNLSILCRFWAIFSWFLSKILAKIGIFGKNQSSG